MKNNQFKSTRKRLRGMLAYSCFALLVAGAANAEDVLTGIRLSDGTNVTINEMTVGNQLVLQEVSGNYTVFGHTLALENFSGTLGYSSEAAYIVAISGRAELDGNRVKSGRVLTMPAFDGSVSQHQFDANRYAAQWDAAAQSYAPDTYSSLMRVARRQNRGKFFGYYQTTTFNIAAPVTTTRELARRSVLGAESVQDVRFSGISEPVEIERAVISRFLSALGARDISNIAALMDPAPYGGDLRGGADAARELMAKRLISKIGSQNTFTNAVLTQNGTNQWTAETANGPLNILLRPTPDFTYIQSISFEREG